ncbi:hypothetical protein B0H34DRAFT_20508 [Crassisporium funariophilum]|nr:hypothetical protein B0H34DRAFT_20508 [Crassisporium funariophilum]
MPRPRPLTNVASGVPYNSDQQLTPRTPHSHNGSRTSRAEQGFAKLQVSEANSGDDDDPHDSLQSAPLLVSSSTARFSIRSARQQRSSTSTKSKGHNIVAQSAEILSTAVSRLPLVLGIFAAGILVILIVLSFTRPEALHRYVGAKAPGEIISSTSLKPSPTAASSLEHMDANHLTLSYENYTTFPLHPKEYGAECAKLNSGYMSHGDYWDITHMGAMDVQHHDAIPAAGGKTGVCSSSITYMLDGMVGLTADLALLAQAAALARERNRTFFIDDTYWNRGKYASPQPSVHSAYTVALPRWTDHFEDVRAHQPGPEPGCKAPPAEELVACPRTARHWVINSRTAKFHLGHSFSNHYENAYGHNINRLKPIFESARQSFESTIWPNTHNTELIQLARSQLTAFLQSDGSRTLVYTATHIRRGDRKPASYGFANNIIPLQTYIDGVESTWARLHTGPMSQIKPVVYVASDSPAAQEQFSEMYEGETFSLFETGNPRLRELASPGEYYQKTFDELNLQSRIMATRGMVVDLAMVSGLWPHEKDILPDATVCSISSNVCKLAAVGLGWERAFGEVDEMGSVDEKGKHWIEIDEKGQIVPVWQAFQLF